jgi:hypothetical protein
MAWAPLFEDDAQTQALASALEAALTIKDERTQARALASLNAMLTSEELRWVLFAVLTRQARGRTPEAREERANEYCETVLEPALRRTGKFLRQSDDETQTRAVEVEPATVRSSRDEWLQAKMLESLDHLHDNDRADSLVHFAPRLEGKRLEQGLQSALTIQDEWARARSLAALAPQLKGEALDRGLAAALAIEQNGCRAYVLGRFLPMVSDPTAVLRSARQALADHLLTLSAANRARVLGFCADEKLFAPPLLDQDTLAAIAGHIVEVCQEWQWM